MDARHGAAARSFANDDKERQRCEALSRTMDGLNSRFGQTVVSVGPGRRPPVAMSDRRSATRAFQRRRTMVSWLDAIQLRENTGNKRGHGSAGSTGLKMGQSC
jgi:hypothetical protein